ncbi:MAG: hypothetical protein ACLFVO_29075 [Chloroflexaceae bacterium]
MRATRATANADPDQVLPCSAGDIAAGRVEETQSFFTKMHNVHFCEKRKKAYHAAAGESGFHWVKRPV